MKARIVFFDGTWIIGSRVSFWDIFKSGMRETSGTHHWWVEDVGIMNLGVRQIDVGDRIAIPISSMKYCVFAEEFYGDGTTIDKELRIVRGKAHRL